MQMTQYTALLQTKVFFVSHVSLVEVLSVLIAFRTTSKRNNGNCKTGLSNQCLYSLFALLESYREKLREDELQNDSMR